MSRSTVELQPVEDSTLRAQVAGQIIRMVTGGHFAAGQKLTETELATQLKVSRAPLREAIRELVNKGILVSHPYKGLQVRSISRKDLEELYSMRSSLEKFAFSLAWPIRTTATLEDLIERYERLIAVQETGDQARTIELELTFHSWVYEMSDHQILLDHWRRLSVLVQIYMSLHHSVHGSHGEFRAMTTRYMELAEGNSLTHMLEHIDDHMKQGLTSVLHTLPDSV